MNVKKEGDKRSLFIIGLVVLAISLFSFGASGPKPSGKGFTHGIVVLVDGEEYYLDGAPDGPDGATDIPGHYWVIAGKDKLVGKHYNIGPFEAPQWWSSDARDGELLYIVHGRIDTWDEEKAAQYASEGFTHYHELVRVSDGQMHPSKVVWLKHTARTTFTLDGGPRPDLSHEVRPGIDVAFIPNWPTPYPAPLACTLTGEYWFVHYNLFGEVLDNGVPVPDPALNQLFQEAHVVSGWGTLHFNSDGTFYVDTLSSYLQGGMSEHRHAFDSWSCDPQIDPACDEGYIEITDTVSGPISGTVTEVGNRLIINPVNGSPMVGAVSEDCSTIISVDMAGNYDTDVVFAVRKPSVAPDLTNTKLLALSPHLDIRYDAQNYLDFLVHINNLHIFDSAADISLEWWGFRTFDGIYNTQTQQVDVAAYQATERARMQSGTISQISIANDGFVTFNPPEPQFLAFGTNESGVIGGQASEFDPGHPDQHHLAIGFLLNIHDTQSIGDLVGDWVIGLLESDLWTGDDSLWGTGDEEAEFSILFGDVSFDAAGNVAWNFDRREAFSHEASQDIGTGTVQGPFMECYKLNMILTDPVCSGGVQIPVFHVIDPNQPPGQLAAKITLDKTKKVMGIWQVIDTNDIPENSDTGCPTVPNLTCYDAVSQTTMGIGVKIQ